MEPKHKSVWKRWIGWWRPESRIDGPDLFEYAAQNASAPERPEGKERRRPILALVIGLACGSLGCLLGYLLAQPPSCSIERHAIIYEANGAIHRGYLDKLTENDLQLFAGLQSPETPNADADAESISLGGVRRIDLLPPPEPEPDRYEMSEDERRFLGRYRVRVSGHDGTLVFYERPDGRLGGSLRFHDWGNGVTEYVYGIHVVGRHIRFTRSCRDRRCAEIGAPRPFTQVYSGSFTQGNVLIEGAYSGGSNDTRWQARRF